MNSTQMEILKRAQTLSKLYGVHHRIQLAWVWGPDNTIEIENLSPLPYGVTAEEIEEHATASTPCELWFLRAVAARNGIPIPACDWYYFNSLPDGLRAA